MVEVAQHERDGTLAAEPRDGVGGGAVERAVVEQPGERVARRLLAQPALGVEPREGEAGLAGERRGDVPLVGAQQPRPVEVQHDEAMRTGRVGHRQKQRRLDR